MEFIRPTIGPKPYALTGFHASILLALKSFFIINNNQLLLIFISNYFKGLNMETILKLCIPCSQQSPTLLLGA